MRTSDGTAGITAEPASSARPDGGAGSTLCWPDLIFSRARVATLAAPAQCWTMSGELWEFEDGSFFVTAPTDRGTRRRVDDESMAPDDGWTHRCDCDCPACRVANA